jgi:predicted nucleic acid-binding protein
VIVVDTGVLVAAANRTDQWHRRCADFLLTAPGPLLLPEALLTEIGYMMFRRGGPKVEAGFLRDVADGAFDVVSLDTNDLRRVAELADKYTNLPLGTADACVVAVAEKVGTHRIATVDRKHFSNVRPKHVPTFTMLP